MARHAVVDKDLGYKKILKEINRSASSSVLVGIQEQSKTRSQSKNGRIQKAGESVAEYAAKNEFGYEGIPQRSFIRSTFDENSSRIERVCEIQYKKIIDMKISSDQALGEIGQVVTGMIKLKIRSITSPPNSPKTIEMKKSSKPLVDFGQMLNSISYTIKRG